MILGQEKKDFMEEEPSKSNLLIGNAKGRDVQSLLLSYLKGLEEEELDPLL
jgi:hypothetical protein